MPIVKSFIAALSLNNFVFGRISETWCEKHKLTGLFSNLIQMFE